MALPSSGPISFQDFNSDRALALSSPIDMAHAADFYGVSYDLFGNSLGMDEFYGLSSPLTAYTGCGYGGSVSSTCSDVFNNNRTLYADSPIITLGVGSQVYINQYPVLLTGYQFVQIGGATWELNQNSGTIIAYAEEQC